MATAQGNRRRQGSRWEEAAAQFLEKQGVRILARNFYGRRGEIDIVGQQDGDLVFFEVKSRAGHGAGLPEEAVGPQKRGRICASAMEYLYRNRLENVPVRFDVIAIDGDGARWYRNAFPYQRPVPGRH